MLAMQCFVFLEEIITICIVFVGKHPCVGSVLFVQPFPCDNNYTIIQPSTKKDKIAVRISSRTAVIMTKI